MAGYSAALSLDVLNSITDDEPSIFSFFSVFTEKTQLSHVSKVKYFLINLILMMFCDCKFPVKFHFVWFVCSNLCTISFVFGKPCKSPGTWASPGFFFFVLINNYCAISISFNFYCLQEKYHATI